MTIPQPPATPDPASAPADAETPEAQQTDVAIDEAAWRGVSPTYIVVDLIGGAIFFVVVAVAAVVIQLLWGATWQWWPAGALLLITAITAVFTPRRVRSIGFQLRADDLLFRRGIMWQRIVAIPYGRMQLIDINRGPVARAFGLAELKFVTASTTTGIVIPGLPEEEVEELRDRLVAVAESRRTGL